MLGESKKLLTTNHMRNFICTGSAGEDRGLAVQRAVAKETQTTSSVSKGWIEPLDRTPGGHQASMSAGACG